MSKQSGLLAHAPPRARAAAAEGNHSKRGLIFTVVPLCESSSFQMPLKARVRTKDSFLPWTVRQAFYKVKHIFTPAYLSVFQPLS